ncbi:ABC transporter substrate-binding protein [Schlegelella sp. S2-27]|uniref:ABC transporter substrate-binding protein n=1 Tax=Caldimonas mangrovi TaxID=2944811 RepID=A0ABT0YS95_9BURK|nr:ABC transporter substrate-binding protein [Caldimonas mangrovi]MCM5681605.1 ABC transporter substrate-binding protein [Caldimonas mangrovi]
MKHRIRAAALALALLSAGAVRAELNIGVSLSLTGPLSSLGLPLKASLAQWPDTIAGEKVRLTVLDDASDTTGAVKNARRFVTEQVDVILGSSGVPGVLAIAPVATEGRTVQLAFAPAPRPGGPGDWTFVLPQPVSLMSDAVARRMADDGVRRVAFLGWNEGYGEMWLQAFGASARKAGLEIVATERFAPIDTAITAQALKVAGVRPDAVLIVGAGSAAAMPQINLRERGYRGPIYQTHGAGSPDLVRVGGRHMEGTVLPAGPVLVAEQLHAANPVKAVALEYVSAYEKAHGPNTRTQFGAHAHDALKVLQRVVPVALKQARPGTPAFRQALRDALESEKEIVISHGVLNYTPTDHLGFDERGVVMLRIDGGRFRVLPPRQ